MNVAYCLTNDYFQKAIPSMRSLLHHNPDAKIFVICEADEFPFPVHRVINVSKTDYLDKNGPNYHCLFTHINLYRPIYASLIDEERVIHMDADTVICDSLLPIWETDMTGKWYAAVPEYRGHFRPYGPTYYNMGVAVINLDQMRKDNTEADMLHLINKMRLTYPDQDAYNLHTDKAVTIDVRYNETQITGQTDDPAVVHYAGYAGWYSNPNIPRYEYLARWIPPHC